MSKKWISDFYVFRQPSLSIDTHKQCKLFLNDLPARSGIRIGFTDWLDKHLEIAETLGVKDFGLPSASDILESLFGIAKQHGTGNTKDANRIALRIPALCGEITKSDAQKVLEITVKEQQKVEGPLNSLTKQRIKHLPNPGSINNNIIEDMQHVKLIPVPKKWGKTL